jgi:hypothetical protein
VGSSDPEDGVGKTQWVNSRPDRDSKRSAEHREGEL